MSEEHLHKRVKVEVPEGMSKNAWKRLQKQKRWDESKEQYREARREKKRAMRQRRRLRDKLVPLDNNYHTASKGRKLPEHQTPTGVQFIMDCDFDDLMNEREIVSMSNQIARCYSAKRHCEYDVDLVISAFNGKLKERFDKAVSQYKLWQNFTFVENASLEELLPKEKDQRDKYVYLTADTDEVLESLEPDHKYIIGGIVDKNRHKLLCVNKAKELGLRVGRLPIDKYIQLNGRQVLATSHVYEICCKWFENGKDWGRAFNEVLPPRKVRREDQGEKDDEEEETQHEEKDKQIEEGEHEEKNEDEASGEEEEK